MNDFYKNISENYKNLTEGVEVIDSLNTTQTIAYFPDLYDLSYHLNSTFLQKIKRHYKSQGYEIEKTYCIMTYDMDDIDDKNVHESPNSGIHANTESLIQLLKKDDKYYILVNSESLLRLLKNE